MKPFALAEHDERPASVVDVASDTLVSLTEAESVGTF